MDKIRRAQFSTIFSDEVLYDQFVEPLKKAKELSDLVIKLLSVYYYNDDIRSAIDGCVKENETESTTNVKALELLNSAKDNLFVLGACINSANGSVEDGLRIMKEYSEKVTPSSETESPFGKAMFQLNLPKSNIHNESSSSAKIEEPNGLESRVESLETNMFDIKSLLQTIVDGMPNGTSLLSSSEKARAVGEKSDTSVQITQSSLPKENESDNLSGSIRGTEEVVDLTGSNTNVEEDVDGADILKSLMSSFKVN